MSELSFTHPWLLALLAALPLLALLRWWWAAALARRQAGLGVRTPRLTASRSPVLVRLRLVLLWSGLAALVVAAAGPRWGEEQALRSARGANLAVVIDCSRSMLADDLYPSRIELARRKALDLMATAPEHRMAVVPFAGGAFMRCPLTGDRGALRRILADVGPELFPAEAGLQGTAIAAGIREAIAILADTGDRGRAILVLSDGDDRDREAVAAAAERARSADIRVYGIFLGDPEREVTVTIDGREQVMQADRETLVTLAEATRAITVNATLDDSDVRAIADHIAAHVNLLPWQERSRSMNAERYRFALLPALLLIAAGACLPTRRRRMVTA